MYHSKSEANPIDVPTPSSNSRRLGRKPCVTFPNIKKKISAPTIKKITSIHRNPRFSAPGGCSPFWALLDFISAGWKSPCMTPRVCDWTLKPTRRGWCRKLLLNRDVKNDGFLRSDRNGGVVKCGFMLGCRCFFWERGTVSVHFLNLLVVVYSCLIATFPQAACIVQAGFFSEKVERWLF